MMLSLIAAGRDALLGAHTEPQLAAHTEQQLVALFHLEAARFHTLFHEVREMVRSTEEAAACVGLSVKDTGALGKRTKYQVIIVLRPSRSNWIFEFLKCVSGSFFCNLSQSCKYFTGDFDRIWIRGHHLDPVFAALKAVNNETQGQQEDGKYWLVVSDRGN
jgi:hypothetical protein